MRNEKTSACVAMLFFGKIVWQFKILVSVKALGHQFKVQNLSNGEQMK